MPASDSGNIKKRINETIIMSLVNAFNLSPSDISACGKIVRESNNFEGSLNHISFISKRMGKSELFGYDYNKDVLDVDSNCANSHVYDSENEDNIYDAQGNYLGKRNKEDLEDCSSYCSEIMGPRHKIDSDDEDDQKKEKPKEIPKSKFIHKVHKK